MPEYEVTWRDRIGVAVTNFLMRLTVTKAYRNRLEYIINVGLLLVDNAASHATVRAVRRDPDSYEVLIILLEGKPYWCPGRKWVDETPIEDTTMPGTCLVARRVDAG